MTKQQKEITQLKREIRKLERDKRMLEAKTHETESGLRYWQREYNRLLDEMQTKFSSKRQETKPQRDV